MDKYRSNSAGSMEEYAAKHQQYETEIGTLSSDANGKQTELSEREKELGQIDKEKDPEGYEAKNKEVEQAQGVSQEADAALSDKQAEFDQYQQDNKGYAAAYEAAQQTKEQIESTREQETEVETSQEPGEVLSDQTIEAEHVAEGETAGKDNVNVHGQDTYKPKESLNTEQLAAARAKAETQFKEDPSIKEGLSEVEHQPDQEER